MKYRLTIETLTPLHIGSGDQLLLNFDYVSDGQNTYILDQDAIYAHELEQKGSQARLDLPAGKLIATPSHPDLQRFVRYTLSGATRRQVERLDEQIKNPSGGAYLPGSSLKGGLRRALMTWAIAKGLVKPDWAELEPKKEAASQSWERSTFGSDANHDLLRLLQVSDSDARPDCYTFVEARVFQAEAEPGPPIDLEAVRRGVSFTAWLSIDELLLGYQDPSRPGLSAAERLGWGDHPAWLTVLPGILREVALHQAGHELEQAQAWGWQEGARFYQELLQKIAAAPPETAFLQIGWGGGWQSTSLSPVLDREGVFELQVAYDLGKPRKAGPNWKPDPEKPFPASRRLVTRQSAQVQDYPGEPLGWLQVAFEPAGAPRDEPAWQRLKAQAAEMLARPWTPLKYRGKSHFPAKKPGVNAPPRPTPARPTPPPAPPAPPPPPQRKETFGERPEIGVVYPCTVFDIDLKAKKIYLSFREKDPDSLAYAVLSTQDILGSMPKDGAEIEVQVKKVEMEFGIIKAVCKPA